MWIAVLIIVSATPALSQKLEHNAAIEQISFSYEQFELVGNLYLPSEEGQNALMIYVHGDGPHIRTSHFPDVSFFNRFQEHGFAYFRYDKPGSGDSKGEFTDSLLIRQRAGIVNAAVEKLKSHPNIDSLRIGLAGGSQAGYVMPLVLKMRNDISFMVGLSLPAMSGNEQWAYLLKQQMICEGYDSEFAEEFSSMHLKLIRSPTYEEYLENVAYFDSNPVNIPSLNGYDDSFATRIRNWWPLDWAQPQEFDPMEIVANTRLPVLSLYGEHDTQINPFQGAEVYKQRLQEAGHPLSEVHMLTHADHNMWFSETGCLKEQQKQTGQQVVPELAETVDKWLRKLREE